MEIYYLLLNNVEIKIFEDNLINIAGENIAIKLKDQISNLLFAWTGEKWNVIITKQLEISTLKRELIDKLKVSEEWKMIQQHFPEANISDILIKT
jgi:DNA polymerase-3 subunit gamma/tau